MKKEEQPKEFTLAAFAISVFLSLLLTASNTYLGLKAGLTIAASIPAAVASMLVLRGIFRRGTIYENNIVQTFVAAGGSMASGIIFVLPALILMGIWQSFDYWTVTLIAILGGVMGVLIMVPLRRSFIVESKELIYPEGVAIAEVLLVGDKGIKSGIWLIIGIAVGMIYKFFISFIVLIKESIIFALKIHKTGIVFGFEVSPALLGIGFIVGFRIAILVVLGAVLGWVVFAPIYLLFINVQIPVDVNFSDFLMDTMRLKIRFVGMGTMLVAGVYTIYSIRKSIGRSLQYLVQGLKKKGNNEIYVIPRTDKDLPYWFLYGGIVIITICLFILMYILTHSIIISTVTAVIILIAAFFFVAVSSYVVGLVGSSSNPVSGMILTSLILSSLIFLLLKQTGIQGMISAILVGGAVGVAASLAGDTSQDLKSGLIIGGTPYKMQLADIIGTIIPAFIIAPILNLLHKGYVLGSVNLPAPQAGLMKMIVEGILGRGHLDYTLIIIGIIIGIVIISMKLPAMPVAVGIYLPFTTSCTIFLGGFLNFLIRKFFLKNKSLDLIKSSINDGILFSSGLIAGEALVGIIIAALIITGINGIHLINSTYFSLIAFIILGICIVISCIKKIGSKNNL
jgi:putative OPT family oligopeptide transporter